MKLSRQFTRREKVLLLILVALMVVAAYYLAVFMPVTDAVADLQLKREDLESQVAIADGQKAALIQMKEELAAYFINPGIAEIPDYNNLQELMTFLNTTLAETEDYQLDFEPPAMPEEGSIVRRVLHMSFSCPSYQMARGVIADVHASPYRCLLESLTVTPLEGADIESGAIRVSLTVVFYENNRQPLPDAA